MRLVIDIDEKYKNLFFEAARAAKATIVVEEPDFWTELPEHVKAGIEKGLEQAKNGQTKSYEEVKKILANR
jgi:predicted transcriptional regulator